MLLQEIGEGVDDFDSREINVSDVTENFYDLSARLKTKKEIEQRYLQILSRAGNIKDVLEVERQIGDIRTEIERIEGRLKYLQNQVSYSTLTVTYYKVLSVSAQQNKGFFKKLRTGFVKGWDFLLSLVIGIVHIWPVLILLAIGLIVARKRRSKRKK